MIDEKIDLGLYVNGREVRLVVSPEMTLLQLLRESLHLTGTKEGCGKGDCGACTVLVNDAAVNACLILAGQMQGKRITTIEGLQEKDLHPIQRAFIEEGAVQCGFCIPGMIMTAVAFLKSTPKPTRDEIRQAISGNLCRCTGYQKIINAIEKASHSLD